MNDNANIAVARWKPKENDQGSCDVQALKYFMPAIRMISEIQVIDPGFTNTNKPFVFMAYLTNRVYLEVGFNDIEKAGNKRMDIILAMADYWGSDNMIFVNGFDHEVLTLDAVSNITEIRAKNHRYLFTLIVSGAPYPVNMIFAEEGSAQQARELIAQKKENDLIFRVMDKKHVDVNESIYS